MSSITLPEATHLLDQYSDLPPEMAPRIVALGATYDQTRQALSATMAASQKGLIRQSKVGFFLKTIENLKKPPKEWRFDPKIDAYISSNGETLTAKEIYVLASYTRSQSSF